MATSHSSAKKARTRRPAAKKSTRAESVYVSLVLDAAAELTEGWESAGRKLLGRLETISKNQPIDVPGDVLDALADAARSNDIGEILSAQQAFAEASQSTIDRATSSYSEAIEAYTTELQDLWSVHSGRHAALLENYVADVRRRLEEANGAPAAVAQLGWSLIAASQFASATGAGG